MVLPSMVYRLTIHFPEHNIYRPQNHHCIRQLVADTHLFQAGQVDKSWGADMVAVGVRLAVADDEEAELAFGSSMRP